MRPVAAGAHTERFIQDLKDGDDTELYTDEDDPEDLPRDPSAQEMTLMLPEAESPRQTPPSIPTVLQRVLGSEGEAELLAVAKIIDGRTSRPLGLVFHTPIGSVRTPVVWSSCHPDHVDEVQDLLLILVRSSDAMFVPDPGASFDISFAGRGDGSRLSVTCLARPMQLYPGVGIDLLCFLPHSAVVEKNGQLRAGAPSAVSGVKSDTVDENGEPVVDGEKSASFRPAFRRTTEPDTEDFDRPRDDR